MRKRMDGCQEYSFFGIEPVVPGYLGTYRSAPTLHKAASTALGLLTLTTSLLRLLESRKPAITTVSVIPAENLSQSYCS